MRMDRRAAARSRRGVVGGVLRGVVAGVVATAGAGREQGEVEAARCRNGRTRCRERCRDLTRDRRNCGRCGRRCGSGEACDRGLCCPAGEVNCRGACSPTCEAPAANRPFPQAVAYPGVVNEPSRWTPDAQADHVRAAYDRWKRDYLVAAGRDEAGQPRWRVAWGKRGSRDFERTISEGQGYGLVILAHMAGHDPDAQALFDGVWRFSRDHPSRIEPRLMQWKVPTRRADRDSAFDGDCDIAYGLLLAAAQWGTSPDPAIAYGEDARRVIAGILAATIGQTSRLPTLGDFAGFRDADDGDRYNQWTPRSSDFMLANFRAFGRATGDPVWDEVVDACRRAIDALQSTHSPTTGLLPDFVEPASATAHAPQPARPNFLEGPTDGDFFYNAARVPWRLGVHALLAGDADSAGQAARISRWAEQSTGGDPRRVRSGYRLSGQPLPDANYFDTCFAAPLGVAAMVVPGQQAWLDEVYAAVVAAGPEDYFDDTVGLLCLLALTGTMWDPTVD